MTTLLEEILYDSPDKTPNKAIDITREMVQEKLRKIVLNRDLSRYIL
jgi:ATP-dependent HslUV protease ATP-binding subunit HslU